MPKDNKGHGSNSKGSSAGFRKASSIRVPKNSDPAVVQRNKAIAEQRSNPRGGMTPARKPK